MKQVKIPGVFMKNLWNFHGSWFFTFEFPGDFTQFCRISRGESLFFLQITNGKVTNLKIPGVFFQKSISLTSPVWIFYGGHCYMLITMLMFIFSKF